MSMKLCFWETYSRRKPRNSNLDRPSARFHSLRFYGMILANLLLCGIFFLCACGVSQRQLSQQAAHLTGSLQASSALRLLDNDMQNTVAQSLLSSDESSAGFMDSDLREHQQDMDNSPSTSTHSDNLRVDRSYKYVEAEDSVQPGRILNSVSEGPPMDVKKAKHQESSADGESVIDIGDLGTSDNSSSCDGHGCGGDVTTSEDAKAAAGDTGSSNLESSVADGDNPENSHARDGNEDEGLVSNSNPGNGAAGESNPEIGSVRAGNSNTGNGNAGNSSYGNAYAGNGNAETGNAGDSSPPSTDIIPASGVSGGHLPTSSTTGPSSNTSVFSSSPPATPVAITPPVYYSLSPPPVYGSSPSNERTAPTPTIVTPQPPPQISDPEEGQLGQQEATSDVGCPSGTRISSALDDSTGGCGADRVLLQVRVANGKAKNGDKATTTDGAEAAVVVQPNSTALMCASGPNSNAETSSLSLTLCWRPKDLPEGPLRTAAALAAAIDSNGPYDSNVSTGLIMTLPQLTWYGISSMAPGDYSLTVYGADSFGAVVHATANNNVSVAAAGVPPALPAVTSSFESLTSEPPPLSLAVARTVTVPAGGISALTVWFSVAAAATKTTGDDNSSSISNNDSNNNNNGAGGGCGSCNSSSAGVGSAAGAGAPSLQQGAGNPNGNGSGNGKGDGNGGGNGNSSPTNSSSKSGNAANGNGSSAANGPCRSVTITLVRQVLPSEPLTSMPPPVLPSMQASQPLTSATPPPASLPVPPPLTSTPPSYTLPVPSTPPPYTLPVPLPSPQISPSYRCKCPLMAPSLTSCPSSLAPLVAIPFPTASTTALVSDVNITSAVQCVPPPLYDRVTRRLTFSTCWRYRCLTAVFVRPPPYELLLGPVSLTEATSLPAGTYRMRVWVPERVILSYESLGAASSSSWQAVTVPTTSSGTGTVAMSSDVRLTVPYGGLRQIRIRIQVPADPAVDDTSVSLEMALLRLDPRGAGSSSTETTSEAAVNTTGQAGSSSSDTTSSSSGMVLETPDGSGVAVPPPLPAITLTNANATLKVVSELWINRRIISNSSGGGGNASSAGSGGGGSSQQSSSVSELVDMLRQGLMYGTGDDSSVSDPQNASAATTSSTSTSFEDSVTLQGFRLTLPLGIQSVPSPTSSTATATTPSTTSYPPSYETTTPGGLLADCSEASLTVLRASAATALATGGNSSYSTATLSSMGCLYGSYDGSTSGRRRALLQTQTCTAVVTVPLVVDVPPVDLDSYLTTVTSSLALVYGDSACPLDPASSDIGVISKLAISISLPAARVLSATSSASSASGTDGSAMTACTTGAELLASSLGLVEGEAHLVGCQLSAEAPGSDTAAATVGSQLPPTSSGNDQGSYGSTAKRTTPIVVIVVAGVVAAGVLLLAAMAVVATVSRRRGIRRRGTLKSSYDKDLTSSASASAWASRAPEYGTGVSYDGGVSGSGSKEATLVMGSPSKRLRASTLSGDGYGSGVEKGKTWSRRRLTEYCSLSLDGGDGDRRCGDVGTYGGENRDSFFLAVVPTSPIASTEERVSPVWYGSAMSPQIRDASRPTISPYSEGAVSIGWYDYFGLDEIECDAEYDRLESRPSSYGGAGGCGNGGGYPHTARSTFALRRSNAGNLAWLDCSNTSNEDDELSGSIIVCPTTPSPALAATPRSSPEGNHWGPRAGTVAVAAAPPPMLGTVRALRLSFALPGADPALYGYENLDSVSTVVQGGGDGGNGGGGMEEDGELLRVQSRRPAFLDGTGGSLAAAVAATVAIPRRAVRHLYGALLREPMRSIVAATPDRQGGGSGGNGGSDSRSSAGRGYIRRNTIVPYRGDVSTSYLSYKLECQSADSTAPVTPSFSVAGNDRSTGFIAWSARRSSHANSYDNPYGVEQQSPFSPNPGTMYDVFVDRSAWSGVVIDTRRRNSCSSSSPSPAAPRGSGPRTSQLSGSASAVRPPYPSPPHYQHSSAPAGGYTSAVDSGDRRTLRQPPRLQTSCKRLLQSAVVGAGGSAPAGDDTAAMLAAAVCAAQSDCAVVQNALDPPASSSATQQTPQQLAPDRLPPVVPFFTRKDTLPPIQPNTPQIHDIHFSSPSSPPPPATSSPPPSAPPSRSRTTAVVANPPPAPPTTVPPTTPPSPLPFPTRTSPRLEELLPVVTRSPSTRHGPRSSPRSPRPWFLHPPHPLYTRSSSLASSSFASLSALPNAAAAVASGGGGGSLAGLVDPDVEACASGGAARLAQLRRLDVGPPRPAWGLVHAGVLPFHRSAAPLQYIQSLNDRPAPTPRAAAAAVSLAAAAAVSGVVVRDGAGNHEYGEYRGAVPGRLLSRHSTGSMSVTSTESVGFSRMKFEL